MSLNRNNRGVSISLPADTAKAIHDSWKMMETIFNAQYEIGCGEISFDQAIAPHIRKHFQSTPQLAENFLNFCMSFDNPRIKLKAKKLLKECKQNASGLPAPPEAKVIADAIAKIQAKEATGNKLKKISASVYVNPIETKEVPPLVRDLPLPNMESLAWDNLTNTVKKCKEANIDHCVFDELVVPFLKDPMQSDYVRAIDLLTVCIKTKNEIVKPQVRDFLRSEISKSLTEDKHKLALDSVVQFVHKNIVNEQQFCLELIQLCIDSSLGDVKERAIKLYEQYAPNQSSSTHKPAKVSLSSKPKPQALPKKNKQTIDEDKMKADKAIADALRAENEAKALKKAEEEKKIKAEIELNTQLRELEKAKKIAAELEEEKRRAEVEIKKIADAKKAKQEKAKQEADAAKLARKERKNKAKERKKQTANLQPKVIESQPEELESNLTQASVIFSDVVTPAATDIPTPAEISSPIKSSNLNPNSQAFIPATIEIKREVIPYFIIDFLDKIERFTKRRAYLGGSMVAKLILKSQNPEYIIEYTDLDIRIENFLGDKDSSQEVLFQKMEEWKRTNQISKLKKIKGNYPSIITRVPDGEFLREFDISIWERGDAETTDEAFITKIENECDSTYSAMLLRPTSDTDTLNVIASQKTIKTFLARINDTVRDPRIVFAADLRCVLRWIMKEDFFADQQFQNSIRVTQTLTDPVMLNTWFYHNLTHSDDKDLQQKWLSTFIGNVLFKRLGIVEAIELLDKKYGILSAMTGLGYNKFRPKMACMDYYDNSHPYAKQLAFYVLVYALRCIQSKTSHGKKQIDQLHHWPFFEVIKVIEKIAKKDFDTYIKPIKKIIFSGQLSDEELSRLLKIVPQNLLPMDKRPAENKVQPMPLPVFNPPAPHYYGTASHYDPRLFYYLQPSINLNLHVNLNVPPTQIITIAREKIIVPRKR